MTEQVSYEQLRARLARIEGQIRGISRMLESDRTCEEVVTQLMAVRSGIDTVGALVLDTHLQNCVEHYDVTHQVESLRDSMRLWWRFAPGAAGFGAAGFGAAGSGGPAMNGAAAGDPTPGSSLPQA